MWIQYWLMWFETSALWRAPITVPQNNIGGNSICCICTPHQVKYLLFLIPNRWHQHETLQYCPPTCWSFRVGLNENANSFFATRGAALSGITCMMKWKKTNRTNCCRLALGKGGVWKNQLLSESFWSRWASKVKINACYKTMDVFFFFYLAYMSTCCWGLPKPKYEPFITHNRGTLIGLVLSLK